MDEEATALDAELRQLYDAALTAISSLKSLGAPGTKSKASELNKDISGTCKQWRGYLRDLEQLAEEQDTPDASLQVEQLVKQHKVEYERLKSEQELAISEMKKKSELAWRAQRQELLAGGISKAQIKDDRTAIAASEGITESLRRTRQLMTEQIGATDANTQLIGSSTSVLGKTTQTLESQRGLFASSRRLLATMSWYDVLDKVVLYGGVGFFILVVVYILQKRMLGLTPQIVKATVTSVISQSIGTATDYYRRYVNPDTLDPVKPSSAHFDDLDDSSWEFIKAVNDVSVQDNTQNDESVVSDAESQDEPDAVEEFVLVSFEQSDVSSSVKKTVDINLKTTDGSTKERTDEDIVSESEQTETDSLDALGQKQIDAMQKKESVSGRTSSDDAEGTQHAANQQQSRKTEAFKDAEEVERDPSSETMHMDADTESQSHQELTAPATETADKESDSASDDSHLVIPDKHSIKDATEEVQQDYDPYEEEEEDTHDVSIEALKDEL